MRRTISLFVSLFFLVGLCFPSLLHANDNIVVSKNHIYSIEPFASIHIIPALLLGIEADVYPKDGLKGHAEGLRAGYLFNDKYTLGLALFHADVSGTGPWGDKSEEASHGVTGNTHGTVNMEIFGFGVEATRRFYIFDNLNLLLRLGLGVGYLDVQFHGFFNGNVLQDPSIEIHELAEEYYNRIIPLIGLGAELEWCITRRLSLIAGPYWNTGFGAEVSLLYRFDIFE